MSSSIGKAQPQQPSGKPGKTAAKLEHEIYIQIHTVYQNIHILNAKVKNRPCNLALKRHRSQLQLLQVQRSFEVSNGAEIRKLQTFSRPATAKHRKERVVCKEKIYTATKMWMEAVACTRKISEDHYLDHWGVSKKL